VPRQAPEAFLHFKSLVRIHLKQILTLDRTPPTAAVVLLVVVACEALSKLFGRPRHDDIFARDLLSRRGVPYPVGQVLFHALRDGLTHQYSPHRIVLDGQEMRLSLTWKDPLHLRIVGVRSRDGHLSTVPLSQNEDRWPRLCVDAETLWRDLDALFDELEHALEADRELAQDVERNSLALVQADEEKERPGGEALRIWKEWAERQSWEGSAE